jgi:protein involved in polysaccharide export with SLBB domain
MNMRLLSIALTVLCFSLSLSGQITPERSYYNVRLGRLKPGDALRITLFKQPDVMSRESVNLSVRRVVSADGKLSVPLLADDVAASGLTIPELLRTLEKLYFAERNSPPRVSVQFSDNLPSVPRAGQPPFSGR